MPNLSQDTMAEVAYQKLGLRVDRPAATFVLLFITTKVHLYQIVGGRILLLNLYGECAATGGADATLAKFSGTPTVGTAADLCANSASLISLAIGKRLCITGTLATAATIANAGGSLWQAQPLVLTTGYLDITGSVQGTAGSMKFSAFYAPLDDGAYMVAV